MAPISVGDSLPDGQLGWFDENDQLQQVSIHSLAAGKKVILFGVPGAFTPTCRFELKSLRVNKQIQKMKVCAFRTQPD
ncbi:hypothetical protein EJB05_17452, partial [Eragrostis curvula]